MSTKEWHAAYLYSEYLRGMRDKGRLYITAGEVAKYAGVSRATAKKYLDMAVQVGLAHTKSLNAKNGVMATIYRFGKD